MAFKKGQSGNPNGRKKENGVINELAAKHSAWAFQNIVDLAKNSPDLKIKLAASQYIVDRDAGKPKQQVDVDANVSGNFTVNVDLQSKLPNAGN